MPIADYFLPLLTLVGSLGGVLFVRCVFCRRLTGIKHSGKEGSTGVSDGGVCKGCLTREASKLNQQGGTER